MFKGLTLVVPDKQDIERDAVCTEWQRHDGSLLQLGRFWEPPSLDPLTARLYGPDTFCLVLAQKLGLGLRSPADNMLARLDRRWLKRDVFERILSDANSLTFPLFVKPSVPKMFRAAVYLSAHALLAECKGLESDTPILTSEPVELVAEARAFILDREVTTCALYEGMEDVENAASMAQQFAVCHECSQTYVIDMGFIKDGGWAVLEFNSTWGAGLNGCDPRAVAMCLAHATFSIRGLE